MKMRLQIYQLIWKISLPYDTQLYLVTSEQRKIHLEKEAVTALLNLHARKLEIHVNTLASIYLLFQGEGMGLS